MSRSTAMSQGRDVSGDSSFEEAEPPTRRVPAFKLADEARRIEEHLAEARLHESEATLNVGAEENLRLLAAVFASEARDTDDEPTLDAPAPVTPRSTPVPSPAARFQLVLTSPPPARAVPRLSVAPAAVVTLSEVALPAGPLERQPPPSGIHPKVTREPRDQKLQIRLPKATAPETWIVAGIWAMALSLLAVLMFMATNA